MEPITKHDPSPLLIHDLKVTVQRTSLVYPPQQTENRSMFLSNIDQVLNFDVQTIHFFPSHKDFPPEIVAQRVKSALERLLVPYDFLAGRMKFNPEVRRLELDCNRNGAGFVLASSECSLEEIGDLVYPNPAFKDLVTSTVDQLAEDDQPLCILQVTSFKCGGFAIGTSTNHATFDGIGYKSFLENLAAMAADKPLTISPCNDRQLLAARNPPHVTFPHPELLKLDSTIPCNAPVFHSTEEPLDFKIFRLSSRHVSDLKDKAKKCPDSRVSSFNAVTAHIWRCKALSSSLHRDTINHINDGDDDELERVSTILYAVNIRPRLVPPLPESYVGNAVLSAYGSGKCRELKEGPFWRLVQMVGEGAKRMTEEYVRSCIDWGEMNKGYPHGEFLISSWWRMGFDEVEYPWGKPKYSCPVVHHRKDIILLFPDIQDKNAVNVLVALPTKQMNNFQALFHYFLTNP
ncbi:hypothetical protein K2173_003839 [Erythroxylum novogranatense]|uniref:Omega-hydroxypalmitate O-feruloyl transferase n=1 Tax=Erythroxylum novogranatense TaxID=1862640 RepID=A0AAV8S3W2_9ROSI|nr:hypothetical protein K2173_003839 [Erythroxylum novogranatense]